MVGANGRRPAFNLVPQSMLDDYRAKARRGTDFTIRLPPNVSFDDLCFVMRTIGHQLRYKLFVIAEPRPDGTHLVRNEGPTNTPGMGKRSYAKAVRAARARSDVAR